MPETHRSVDITVTLGNGARRTFGWATPLPLGRAGNKALSWARQEMTKLKVPGRSRVVAYTVAVTDEPGPFNR